MDSLPDELVKIIISLLNLSTLRKFVCTCTHVYSVCTTPLRMVDAELHFADTLSRIVYLELYDSTSLPDSRNLPHLHTLCLTQSINDINLAKFDSINIELKNCLAYESKIIWPKNINNLILRAGAHVFLNDISLCHLGLQNISAIGILSLYTQDKELCSRVYPFTTEDNLNIVMIEFHNYTYEQEIIYEICDIICCSVFLKYISIYGSYNRNLCRAIWDAYINDTDTAIRYEIPAIIFHEEL